MEKLSIEEARRYLLHQQDLFGNKRYLGKQGILDYFSKHKMIQFDPVDICGRNAEIVLFSRINSFKKEDLYSLLYEENELIEAYDKKLCIILADDWGKLERVRQRKCKKRKVVDGLEDMKNTIIKKFSEVPVQSLEQYKNTETCAWYWKQNASLARIAFEDLFVEGKIRISGRIRNNKQYCLNTYENTKIQFANEEEYFIWHIMRRISTAGLVWNISSSAWDYITGATKKVRSSILQKLINQDIVTELKVDGITESFFCLSEDYKSYFKDLDFTSDRLELIAPLDAFIWDRTLIKELFDFDYKWEIYVPKEKRDYCEYALPILQNDELLGRIELRKTNNLLIVANVWHENKKTKLNESLFQAKLQDFAAFHNCSSVIFE